MEKRRLICKRLYEEILGMRDGKHQIVDCRTGDILKITLGGNGIINLANEDELGMWNLFKYFWLVATDLMYDENGAAHLTFWVINPDV